MPEHHATLIKEWAAVSWINRCPAIIVSLNAFRNVEFGLRRCDELENLEAFSSRLRELDMK